MLEHPEITQIEKTGYPHRRYNSRFACVCHTCDCEMREGDPAYDLGDHIYCEECVKAARFYVWGE